jgi:argininosuccinate lyase
MLLTKGLPLAYNRDLQEDKLAAFTAYDVASAMLGVAAPLIRTAKLNRPGIAARIEDGFLDATTLMEHLISNGVPMRSAHEAVGKLVRRCEQSRCRLVDLPDDAFAEVGAGPNVRGVLGVANALNAFRSLGSTAPERVHAELERWQNELSSSPR